MDVRPLPRGRLLLHRLHPHRPRQCAGRPDRLRQPHLLQPAAHAAQHAAPAHRVDGADDGVAAPGQQVHERRGTGSAQCDAGRGAAGVPGLCRAGQLHLGLRSAQ